MSESNYMFLELALQSEFWEQLTEITQVRPYSSTVLNMYYQVILMTELLDTANIVNIPANLSTPFDYLTNSDTDTG